MTIHSTPVLIIGAGAAGLRVAIELKQRGVDCLVVGKRAHGDAHTVMAAGGINAALGSLDAEDHWTVHAADTLREGHFVCDARAVEILAQQSPERVRELHDWGCDFDLTVDGKINQRYFGAQTYRRTCFVGDRTGDAILSTLVEQAQQLEVAYVEDLYITRLVKRDGRVVGAAGFELHSGRDVVCHAATVVLAAGGFTSLYGRSTSRRGENTGDAAALALDVGARLRDMEMVQFHPTGMVAPQEWRGHLVTEAIRGEGGRLVNIHGERFMERYSPERLELDARDVVARAIDQELREGRGTERGGVLLDISHRPPDYIRERLPRMYSRFKDLGIDITREPVEVAPTAHYAMGGVEVDFETGRTSVERLYAVGEAAAGVHGANRLGGNSLAETVVFGKITGEHIAETLLELPSDGNDFEAHLDELDSLRTAEGSHGPSALIDELGEVMWHHAGIIRHGRRLKEGLAKVQSIADRSGALDLATEGRSGRLAAACNLRFMLITAEAILRSAIERAESRGAHYREDAPEERSEWRRNVIVHRNGDGGMRLETTPAGSPSAEVQEALDEETLPDYHHLE